MRGRKTGGRRIGTRNKSTMDLKALAQPYGPDAIEVLAKVMRESPSDTARIAAARELLDRAYGKAKQPIDHAAEDGSMSPNPYPNLDHRGIPLKPVSKENAERVYMEMIAWRPPKG